MNVMIRAVRAASLAFAAIFQAFVTASFMVANVFWRGPWGYALDPPTNLPSTNAAAVVVPPAPANLTDSNNNNNININSTSHRCVVKPAPHPPNVERVVVERVDVKPNNGNGNSNNNNNVNIISVPARNDVESGSPTTDIDTDDNDEQQTYDLQSTPRRQVLRRFEHGGAIDDNGDDERGSIRRHDMDVSSPTSSISSSSISIGESPLSISSASPACASRLSLSSSTSSRLSLSLSTSIATSTSTGEIIKGGKKQFFSDLAAVTRSDYAVLDGHRYVLPYVHDKRYRYHVPWSGRSLLDVLCHDEDFTRIGNRAYWENEVLCRRILTRSGPIDSIDMAERFIWSVGDSIWHQRHTHEPPVGSEEIELIHVDERHVVVNKPPSMPVHPCGTYKRNSLIFLVAVMHGFRTLHIVHRLDKQTSGVCIFGRSRQAAADLHRRNREHKLRKTYLAQVTGKIAHDTFACNMPLGFCNGRAVVDHVSGKEAYTSFRKIKYISATDTTLLEAVPTTGRRHQIRAHLLFLDHPIVDDPLYGNGPPATTPDPKHNLHHLDVPRGPKLLEIGRDLKCKDCPYLFMKDIKTHNNPIRLHALMYEGDGFSYRATPPAWARNAGIGVNINMP